MVAMAIWCLLIKKILPVCFRYENIKSHKKSAFYTRWRKSYGCLNKNMAESPPPPPPLYQIGLSLKYYLLNFLSY